MTLREWLRQQDMTQREAADRLGVHEITMCRYVSHKQIPRRDILAKIDALTGGAVKPGSFYEETVGA